MPPNRTLEESERRLRQANADRASGSTAWMTPEEQPTSFMGAVGDQILAVPSRFGQAGRGLGRAAGLLTGNYGGEGVLPKVGRAAARFFTGGMMGQQPAAPAVGANDPRFIPNPQAQAAQAPVAQAPVANPVAARTPMSSANAGSGIFVNGQEWNPEALRYPTPDTQPMPIIDKDMPRATFLMNRQSKPRYLPQEWADKVAAVRREQDVNIPREVTMPGFQGNVPTDQAATFMGYRKPVKPETSGTIGPNTYNTAGGGGNPRDAAIAFGINKTGYTPAEQGEARLNAIRRTSMGRNARQAALQAEMQNQEFRGRPGMERERMAAGERIAQIDADAKRAVVENDMAKAEMNYMAKMQAAGMGARARQYAADVQAQAAQGKSLVDAVTSVISEMSKLNPTILDKGPDGTSKAMQIKDAMLGIFGQQQGQQTDEQVVRQNPMIDNDNIAGMIPQDQYKTAGVKDPQEAAYDWLRTKAIPNDLKAIKILSDLEKRLGPAGKIVRQKIEAVWKEKLNANTAQV